jgi:hypothetical protein
MRYLIAGILTLSGFVPEKPIETKRLVCNEKNECYYLIESKAP